MSALCGNPTDHIHVPLGGDVDDPGYKLGAGAGEYGLPVLIPGAGEEYDAAQGGRGLPRLARALSKGKCNSFIAGTQVLLANGKYEAIEDVKVGDKVLTTDPKTGKTGAEPVIASFGGTSYDHLVQITVDTNSEHGHRAGIITATEHHKFWNPDRHAWTRADHLTTGAGLRTPDGTTVHVLRITNAPGHPIVRDLTVAHFHTYYVEAGTTPVLVHNSGGCGALYRSDTRSPEDIFRSGFKPKGGNVDLIEHASGWSTDSGYVATTKYEHIAIRRGGNVYYVDGVDGVDVNAEWPDNLFAHEEEIAVPGAIGPERIRGVRLSNGDWVSNPNYRPLGG